MLKFKCHLPKLWLKLNKVKYQKGLRLNGYPVIFRYPNAKISIGKDVTVNSNFFSNLLGLYQRTIIVARDNGHISIGDKVGISGSTIYARDYIEIGDYCLIGANTKVMDNDFHPIDPEQRKADSYDLVSKPVILGKNVFVGCNCIILKGTEIGDNCVIGAGSVVHGKFGPNQIIAGNPAKSIKTIVNEVKNG